MEYARGPSFHLGCAHLTYSKDSDFGVEPIPPGHAQHVRQVQAEVNQPTARGGQVGFGEEGADEETLHDGGSSKCRQEEKHNAGVAVRQDVPPLDIRGRKISCHVSESILKYSRK